MPSLISVLAFKCVGIKDNQKKNNESDNLLQTDSRVGEGDVQDVRMINTFTTIFAIVVVLLSAGVINNAHAQNVRVTEGPTVLHANIAGQWGGHTFCYLLSGERDVFWSATAYSADKQSPTALIGQHPKPGSSLAPVVSRIQFDEPNVKGNNQPQMIRSPDGYIHAFIGVTYTTDNPAYNTGKLRYFRSENPGDVSNLVDRTELIPTLPYDSFHLRMNVGISPDGQRIALVILAISEDGSVPFNTPVIFIGERRGLDFTFQKPISYAEPMGFFYPQVAATNEGIVIIGQVWDNADRATTRLMHLNWDGELINREELPADTDGTYFSFDLRPPDPTDWSKLVLYYNRQSKDHNDCYHELWEYDTKVRRLRQLRSLETQYGMSNSGKWIPASDDSSVFINNPSMGRLHSWRGDILGDGEVACEPLPGANPLSLGYQATASLFAPNVLQGSVLSPGETYIASDCFNPGKKPEESGPCSFLLWRLSIGE